MYGDKATKSTAARLVAELRSITKSKSQPPMEGSEGEVGPSGPQKSENAANAAETSPGNAKTRKEKVDRKPSMGTLRRKAARTAKFWGKQLGVTQPLSGDLIDAAAHMGSISNTSYHTPSIVVGMMIAIRYTTSTDAKIKTEVLSALKRWTK